MKTAARYQVFNIRENHGFTPVLVVHIRDKSMLIDQQRSDALLRGMSQ
jgi:hypothetical protein